MTSVEKGRQWLLVLVSDQVRTGRPLLAHADRTVRVIFGFSFVDEALQNSVRCLVVLNLFLRKL